MPYIAKEQRDKLDGVIHRLQGTIARMELDDETVNVEGQLNYVITKLLMQIYGDKDCIRYSGINDAIGMLECCKLEFYRKVAAPYEDQKEFENGEVKI